MGGAGGSPSVEELVARIARVEAEVANGTLRAYRDCPFARDHLGGT
jgi:hypothetical protein